MVSSAKKKASQARPDPRPDSEDAAAALESTLEQIVRAFGEGAIVRLGAGARRRMPVIASGSLGLDAALGVGGYPLGRIIEIFGRESSGKTTLALHALAQSQRAGGAAAFIDAEHAFDPGYAAAVGVDLDSLLVSQPSSGEEALSIAEMLAQSGPGGVRLIVVDSVAALVPRAELDGAMGDPHMGSQARMMSQALRKLTAAVHAAGVCLLFVNQVREKIGVQFGSPETTPGGLALKFYASCRVEVRCRSILPEDGDGGRGGIRVRAKVVKNKCAPPFRSSDFDIRFGTGIDAESELLELARESRVLPRGGYRMPDGARLGRGKDSARAFLRSPANRPVRDRLETEVRARLLPESGKEHAA